MLSFLEQIKQSQPGTVARDTGENQSVKGLRYRHRANARVFELYYRNSAGIKRLFKIGDYPTLTVTQARSIAKEKLFEIAAGKDPLADKKKLRAEDSIDDFYELMKKRYWGQSRFQKSGWAKDVDIFYSNQIKPKLGHRKMSEVTLGEIRLWHASLKDKPYAANRALEIIKRMYQYAEEIEARPQGSNPCKLVKAFPERSRKRFATLEEIESIRKSLDKYRKKHFKGCAFLELLMLTGARPISLERALWSQLSLIERKGETYGVLTFDGKSTHQTGDEETVIFPPEAMKVLETLPKDSEFILGCSLPQKLWRKIKKDLNLKDLWARDLRRSYATVGMSSGVSTGVISRLQNHRSAQTSMVYQKLFMEPALEAAATISKVVSGSSKILDE